MSDDETPLDGCPISRALAVVGNRSVMLILREAYYGTTRFDDFAKRVGIAESMAAARLRDLVEAGLLDRRPYQEPGQRTRYEYVLTEAGADLLPVVLGLGRWGEKHRPSEQPTAHAVHAHGLRRVRLGRGALRGRASRDARRAHGRRARTPHH